MVTILLSLLIGAALGGVIAYLFAMNKQAAVEAQNKMLVEQLSAAKTDAQQRLQDAEQQYKKQMQSLQDAHEKGLAAFREQLENDTRKFLEERQQELQKGNTLQMDAILNPFRDKLAEMKRAFEESKESSLRNSSSFEAHMKQMMERSQQLGEDARHLTEALKNKGKVQGDWGEQLLASILTNSGLREGIEYEVQENVKDEDGNNLRPDVIVNCPDGNKVIIDSKVSLTGFYNYVSATTDEERQKAERDNLDSIKKHVNELVAKDYSKLVKDAVPTVLMFIPNEGSYILALQKNQNIANDAFRRGVLIINPTNLMLALHLIVQLWQFERKEENDRKIVDAATGMYEKFCVFAESFEKVGNQLSTVQKTYDQARNQLNEGKGNLVKRVDSLMNMGVTSGKQIPASLRAE